MNYHSPIVRAIRNTARNLGVLKILNPILSRKSGYEDAFSSGLEAAIQRGDVVWDIGANVGFYTTKFLDWTGETGSVVAFEPLLAARQKLAAVCSSRGSSPNLTLCEAALSNWEGEATLDGTSSEGGVTTTAHLSDKELESNQTKTGGVKVMTADGVRAALSLPLPTVTKIDVEGYEEEVLKGGMDVFSSLQSKHIFIEIHFERLERRGKGEAPDRIVKLLKLWNFKVSWLDASHLHGFRVD